MKMKKHIISTEEYEAVKQAAKENKHKSVEKRLQVIIMRYEGKKDIEIAEKLDYHRKRVSQLCAEFKKVGLEEYASHKFGGNSQALSDAEEEEILSEFRGKAESGELVTVQEIKSAFDEKRGKDTGRGYIYMVLERHGWRKVMPRSKHPNKASDEEIDSSKKLKLL
jgi:transposase